MHHRTGWGSLHPHPVRWGQLSYFCGVAILPVMKISDLPTKLINKTLFQKPGYRIWLGIFGVACLVSLYFQRLVVFILILLMGLGVWVMPLFLPFRIQDIYNLNIYAMGHLLSVCCLFLFLYCWRKRHRGWQIEVLCVLTFCAAIGLGMVSALPFFVLTIISAMG